MITLTYEGELWQLINVGAERDDKTYAHLLSKTRFVQQKNGKYPVQIVDWIDTQIIKAAIDAGDKK